MGQETRFKRISCLTLSGFGLSVGRVLNIFFCIVEYIFCSIEKNIYNVVYRFRSVFMARHKRKQFHCQTCGNPLEIYRKGKSHRVLVCPSCGIVATNPLPLLAMALPSLLKAGKNILGTKSDTSGEVKTQIASKKPFSASSDAFYIEKALGGK